MDPFVLYFGLILNALKRIDPGELAEEGVHSGKDFVRVFAFAKELVVVQLVQIDHVLGAVMNLELCFDFRVDFELEQQLHVLYILE